MNRPTILIVDDHKLIIDGMLGLLVPDYAVKAVCSARELDAALAEAKFELVLLDLHLGDGSMALDLLERSLHHGARVIIMSGAATDDALRVCIQHGAHGFIDKHLGAQEVLPAVQNVLAGRTAFPDGMLTRLLNSHTHLPYISDREQDVLNLLFLFPGITNETMAGILCRSTGRIRNVATALFQKFNVLDRHELVSKAQKLGYYPSQPAQRDLLEMKAQHEQRLTKKA